MGITKYSTYVLSKDLMNLKVSGLSHISCPGEPRRHNLLYSGFTIWWCIIQSDRLNRVCDQGASSNVNIHWQQLDELGLTAHSLCTT